MFSLIFILIGYIGFSLAVLFAVWKFLGWLIKKLEWLPEVYRLYTYRVTVPKYRGDPDKQKQPPKDRLAPAEMLFATLGGVKAHRDWRAKLYGRNDHFSLDIVADREGLVTFYIAVPGYMQAFFEQQLLAQYPEAVMEKIDDYNIFEPAGYIYSALLTLKKQYIFPIKTYQTMEVDPMSGLTNVLSKFAKKEGAAIQIVARSAHPRWHAWGAKVARTMQQGKNLKQALNENSQGIVGKIFFNLTGLGKTALPQKKKSETDQYRQNQELYKLSPMEEQIVKSLEEKTAKAGFEVNIRLIVSAATKEQAEAKMRNILDAFTQFSGYQYTNAFRPILKKQNTKIIDDFIFHNFDKKHQFILNCEEVASIWHLPDQHIDTPNIRWLMAKKPAPPVNLPADGIIMGQIKYRNKNYIVRLKREDRRRHVYIIGKSGSGKSVLQSSMIIQDIQNGEGVCVVDPHGDLVEDVLPHIPRSRADDVILFDPSDTDRPVGLNMLEYDSDEEKDFTVQEMVSIFYKLFGQEMIGPMFEHYMRNAMLALMEDKEAGATIVEIPRMFTDEKFRREKLQKIKNPVVKNFWEQEYTQSQKGSQAADMLSYVISKIGRFLSNDMMRNIVGQAHSGFNFQDIMNNQKIFLINLAKGKIGDVNSNLLGLILVSKIQMAAFKRASIARELRKDFYLYIDEFQNFTTDSIAIILSEARKYLLNLIIAHQYIGQLVNKGDTAIKDAVFGNAGTLIAFRIGPEDAEFLVKEFEPTFDANDLINVEKFTANSKILIDNTGSQPFNMNTIYPPRGDANIVPSLKQLSRLKYGRDQHIVDAEIRERSKLGELGRSGPSGTPESIL